MKRFRAGLTAASFAFIIALIFSAYLARFSHRNEIDREVWQGLPFWQTLEAFEYRLYDARFFSRGAQTPKSFDHIAIIGIDERTLEDSRWPLPRASYAKIIGKLKAAGARVVATDVDFSSQQNPLDDAALEKAMQDAGNVLLISYLSSEVVQDRSGHSQATILKATTPLDRFDTHTPDLALVYVPPDSDGRSRRYPLYGVINGENVGSLAALAAASYQKILDGNENKNYEQLLVSHRWPSLSAGVRAVPVAASRDVSQEDDRNAPVIYTTPLHFYGPEKTFATHSFIDVLRGDTQEYSPRGLKQKFGGKIVFIGATTHFLKDVFQAPAFEKRAIENNQIPGVELNATATAQLLDGTFIRTQSTRDALLTLFLFTLGASLWTASLRGLVSIVARRAQVLWTRCRLPGQIHAPLWFALYLILGALPIFLFWQACQWFFTNQNLWVIAAYPLLSASASTGAVLLFLFGRESADRRKTQAHFSRLVAPEVMEHMLASGEDYLAPQQICATVLFTDLEGFTTYSESHPPAEVVAVTNEYLSRMVPIVQKHGGCVDKYIGDAIMAFFGAPISSPEHAARALRCAVEMQDECARWRRESGIPFYMRIGVHTGEVIAGYMGSPQRSDYTIIGDTVNLASRLEGKNKEFGSWIMCSAQTFEAAPEVVEAQKVSASIKGKSKEVEIYIVTGLKGDGERVKNWAKPEA